MNSPRLSFRRHRLLIIGAAIGAASLGLMGSASAQAADSRGTAVSAADRKFVEEAAQGGMAEVLMGQMAQQRASHAQVKAFGQRMVVDHGKANEELKRVASAKNVQLPTTLGSAHQRHADGMSKLSGVEFDQAYMKHMVEDHKKDVADFEKAAKSANDANVKNFASRTLPTLQSHLKLAQTTYDAVK